MVGFIKEIETAVSKNSNNIDKEEQFHYLIYR